MSKLFRTMGGFLLTLALLLSMSTAAFAYTDIDTEKTGSITVSPANGQSIGTELTVYQVADAEVDDADQIYVLTEDFAGSGADLTNLDDTGALAEKLAAYAEKNGLSGTVKTVETDGSVTFAKLPLGLYLVIQTVIRPGETIVNPFLVSVPALEGESWIYDVDASPKAETYELVDVTVKKIWNDGGSSKLRPGSIKVELYRDSALIDTVSLDADGGWAYTWTDMDKSDGYSVTEESVSGYTAKYSQDGYTFTITNTGDSAAKTTPTSKTPTSSKLAQTGQLNWPIPLLAGFGLVLFALGWSLVFLKRKENA